MTEINDKPDSNGINEEDESSSDGIDDPASTAGDEPAEGAEDAAGAAEPGGYDISPDDVIPACPACGADMPDDGQVICLRCGHDTRASSSPETAHAANDSSKERAEQAVKPSGGQDGASITSDEPVLCPNKGPGVLTARIAAALAGIVMIVAYLIGVDGLYPDLVPVDADGESPNVFAERMMATFRYVLRVGLSFGIVVGVLKFCSWFMNRPAGRWSELLMRSLTVAVVSSVAMLTSIALPWLEYVTQIAIALLLCFVQLLLLFRLSPKEAGYATAAFALLHGVIVLLAPMISWMYWQ